MDNVLLEVNNLKTNFYNKGSKIEAVRGISFKLNDGEIVGIVGESGSGKSVAMKSILGIIPKNAKIENGEVLFKGRDILKLSNKEKQKIKGKDMAMIFQIP